MEVEAFKKNMFIVLYHLPLQWHSFILFFICQVLLEHLQNQRNDTDADVESLVGARHDVCEYDEDHCHDDCEYDEDHCHEDGTRIRHMEPRGAVNYDAISILEVVEEVL